MTNGIGRALWEIYEDTVKQSKDPNRGVSGATLKFIETFERELEENKIDIYCKSTPAPTPLNKAKNRRDQLGLS